MPETLARYGTSRPIDSEHVDAPLEVNLRELAVATAWNLQGNPQNSAFLAFAEAFLGVPLPVAPNTSAAGAGWTALWLGPRSWLLISDTARTPEEFITSRDACNAAGGALFEVTASRVAFEIRGSGAAQLLAAYCPLDLHPAAFPVGSCAQSLCGHVNAIYYAPAADLFHVFVIRSLGRDTWQSLCAIGARYGATVPVR